MCMPSKPAWPGPSLQIYITKSAIIDTKDTSVGGGYIFSGALMKDHSWFPWRQVRNKEPGLPVLVLLTQSPGENPNSTFIVSCSNTKLC